MGLSKTIWARPAEFIAIQQPDAPVMFFAPGVLQSAARRFIDGFPGLVCYAVAANPSETVIENLAAVGLRGFAVASAAEMRMIRRLAPTAVMHASNPVRSRADIAAAVALGVRSYVVDSRSELNKLVGMVPAQGCEIAVRLAVPVTGATCGPGATFGATPALAVDLLRAAATAGFTPSLALHPGSLAADPAAWEGPIAAAAAIAREAGIRVARLSVGGGFPGHRRMGPATDPAAIFARIEAATTAAFGTDRPALLCEPGQAMVAESLTLATRVTAVRDGADVFLNAAVPGCAEAGAGAGLFDRIEVLAPDGRPRNGAARTRAVFGPTCDAQAWLPGGLALPCDIAEGDHVLFHGLGACSTAACGNGIGAPAVETVLSLH